MRTMDDELCPSLVSKTLVLQQVDTVCIVYCTYVVPASKQKIDVDFAPDARVAGKGVFFPRMPFHFEWSLLFPIRPVCPGI